MTGPDPTLERWRLILGSAGEACTGGSAAGGPGAGEAGADEAGTGEAGTGEAGTGEDGLSAEAAAQDAALAWLYQHDTELDRRDVRREGGSGPSALTAVDWLDGIHRLFPKETIERLERDAVERYGIHEVVTDPAALARVQPNPALLRAVLRTKHLMDPQVLQLARRIVEQVVRELMDRLAVQVQQSFTGARSRVPSRQRRAATFDIRRTLLDNLRHYRPDERRVYVERAHFASRTRRRLHTWQLILVVDQSGSMVNSVIHSAVTAACLWNLPGLRTHLIAFDTQVVDLTGDVADPVELLMKVQLGGGTDIARAVAYAAEQIDQPHRAVVVVISDFFEGGDAGWLVRTVRGLVAQGTQVLGLAALDEQANPEYDHELAGRLADVGAHVGAMTPGRLAEFVAERLGT